MPKPKIHRLTAHDAKRIKRVVKRDEGRPRPPGLIDIGEFAPWKSVRIVTPAAGIASGATAQCRYFRHGQLSPTGQTIAVRNKWMGLADGNRMGYALSLEGYWHIIAIDCQSFTSAGGGGTGGGTGTGTTAGAGGASTQMIAAAGGSSWGTGGTNNLGVPPKLGTSTNTSAGGSRKPAGTPPPPPP